jgi:HTH-type transcriptional regulator / antitoxin HigA
MGEPDSFLPMWASPPGRTIQARLDELGYDVPEFADYLGTSVQVASGLLDGRETITVGIARRLSRVIGASAEFWVNRDCQYRDDLIRVETDRWLDDVPIREMTTFGWISPRSDWGSRAEECLSFFGVQDVEEWRRTYEPMLTVSRMRISPAVPARRAAVAAWLRKATIEAEATATEPWNAYLLRESLDAIKALTRNRDPGDFLPKLRSLLAAAGVALVVQRTLPGSPVSGAARFLSPDRAMIAVSGRFLADDQFWFTVMHEIAHLLLHRPEQAILDDPYSADRTDSAEEQEANRFAADTLLPPDVRARVPTGGYTHRSVITLARAAGIAPGIVVGQLQFAGLIGHDQLNRLKRRYQWNGANLEMA